MPGAAFFPDARLNFAENLLWKTRSWRRDRFPRRSPIERRLSWDELRALVSRLRQIFSKARCRPGDRVAAMLPNMPEAIAGMLRGEFARRDLVVLLARFRRRGRPGALRADRAEALHRVRRLSIQRRRLSESATRSQQSRELRPALTLVVSYIGGARRIASEIERGDSSRRRFGRRRKTRPLVFERLPFNHPLYILFSSGTTARPNASFIRRGARCFSISKNSACTRTSARATGSSTLPLAAG